MPGHQPVDGVLEVALIDVTHADGFASAYREARPILVRTDGCRSARMTRGVESPRVEHFTDVD